ncbi:hypothetical protein GCM10023144_02510 [Pigmentiphaga soli]|uniref:Uncharacterized protein n=1 Tax=Pigmentiphaga soli TaxID=1007095 RepID=A0ABP8GEB7_9BURK
MEIRRIAGIATALVAALVMEALPGHVGHWSSLAQELVWEAMAIVIAAGLGIAFWPGRRRSSLP